MLRIPEIAQAKNMTEAQLQQIAGLSPRTTARYWHNRVRRIDLRTLTTLATALGVDVAELFAPRVVGHVKSGKDAQ